LQTLWDRYFGPVPDFGGMFVGALRSVLSFDWFFGRAAAADQYLVLGDGGCTVTAIATDAGCWAASSGGAGGTGPPAAGDNIIADAASGAGTGTFDASLDITTGTVNTTGFTGTIALATFTLTNTGTITHDGGTITSGAGGIDGGAMTMSSGAPTAIVTITGAGTWRLNSLTIQAGGTFTAASATITMDGNWDSSAGTFTFGTSTVVMNATANLTTVASSGASTFYNLTISASTTTTAKNSVGIRNVFTVNGNFTDDGTARTVYLRNELGGTDPFTLGGSGSVTATGAALVVIYFLNQAGSAVNFPAGTFTNVRFSWQVANAVAFPGVVWTLAGNVSAYEFFFLNVCATCHYRIVTSTFDLTLLNTISTGSGGNERDVDHRLPCDEHHAGFLHAAWLHQCYVQRKLRWRLRVPQREHECGRLGCRHVNGDVHRRHRRLAPSPPWGGRIRHAHL
jgi:hypothetical protein